MPGGRPGKPDVSECVEFVEEQELYADPEEVAQLRGGWRKRTIRSWYDDNPERISENYKKDFDKFYVTVNRRITATRATEKKREQQREGDQQLASFGSWEASPGPAAQGGKSAARKQDGARPAPYQVRESKSSKDGAEGEGGMHHELSVAAIVASPDGSRSAAAAATCSPPLRQPRRLLPSVASPAKDGEEGMMQGAVANSPLEGEGGDGSRDFEDSEVKVVFNDTLQAIVQRAHQVRQVMDTGEAAGPQIIEALLNAIEALTGEVRAGAEKPEYRSAEAVVIEGIGKLSPEEPAEEDADIESSPSVSSSEDEHERMLEEILDVLESIALAGPEYRTQVRQCERVLSELA